MAAQDADAGDLLIGSQFGDDIVEIAAIASRIDEEGCCTPKRSIRLVWERLSMRLPRGNRRAGQGGWHQGKLSGAIKTAERKLVDGALAYSGQSLMAWAVGSARVEPKGNAIVITKQASGTAKIDPLMAAFNAVAWMSANPASSQPSILVI